MDPKMVHADRIGDADAAVFFVVRQKKQAFGPEFLRPVGKKRDDPLPNPRDMRELVAYIRKFDSFVSAYSEHEHWSFAEDTPSFSLELSTEEAFHFEPRRLSRRNKLSWSPHHFFSAQDSDSGWCRGILFLCGLG
ncbi:hypothetical protein M3Y99_01489300 [Aphelenchoides fujianensis]|nr:hypothetical protein M3Y99_01489300 [Aphelenchoides fujianensis]